MATESFAAVLAEMDKAFGMVACNGSVSLAISNEMKGRLAAAHAAEMAALDQPHTAQGDSND